MYFLASHYGFVHESQGVAKHTDLATGTTLVIPRSCLNIIIINRFIPGKIEHTDCA